MEVTIFPEKLNRMEGKIYVIEEEAIVTDGVYQKELEHDNINRKTVNVYSGKKLTGEKIDTYALSTPSLTPWRTEIKVFTSLPMVYISYETTGDTVEADDINRLQEAITDTQSALNSESIRAGKAEESLAGEIQKEAVRAAGEEAKLTNNLAAEVQRSQSAEGVLSESIHAEAARAKEKEEALNLAVTAENTRAVNMENTLADNLAKEETRAVTAETSLDNKKADKTAVQAELDKRYTKEQTFTRSEVLQRIQNIIGAAPEALDTLKEISDALNNDPNFAATMTVELSKKANKPDLNDHTSSKSNPHTVTKAQIGLGNVENTADRVKKVDYAASAGAAQRVSQLSENFKDGTALPSTYPSGITIFFSNLPENRFNTWDYCTVETHKGYSNMVCTQFIYQYNKGTDAPIYYRQASYNTDKWGTWKQIITKDALPASLPANGGNAATVNGHSVNADVPAGAKFTDTVYTHPSTHPASMITGLPTSLPANGGTSAYANYLNANNLAAGTDLNNVLVPGFYYCPANATVTGFKNCPTVNAFFLLVGRHAGYFQMLTEYMTGGFRIFVRNLYAGSWGPWKQVLTTTSALTWNKLKGV